MLQRPCHDSGWLVSGLSSRRPVFDPRLVHVRFVTYKVALGQLFLPVLQFSPVSIIPPMLHTHSFIYHRRCIMFFSQYSSFPCPYLCLFHIMPTVFNVNATEITVKCNTIIPVAVNRRCFVVTLNVLTDRFIHCVSS
jgi:hypothetical protein